MCCTQHLPFLLNFTVTRAGVSADDALGVLHGLDGPNTVVFEVVAVDLK